MEHPRVVSPARGATAVRSSHSTSAAAAVALDADDAPEHPLPVVLASSGGQLQMLQDLFPSNQFDVRVRVMQHNSSPAMSVRSGAGFASSSSARQMQVNNSGRPNSATSIDADIHLRPWSKQASPSGRSTARTASRDDRVNQLPMEDGIRDTHKNRTSQRAAASESRHSEEWKAMSTSFENAMSSQHADVDRLSHDSSSYRALKVRSPRSRVTRDMSLSQRTLASQSSDHSPVRALTFSRLSTVSGVEQHGNGRGKQSKQQKQRLRNSGESHDGDEENQDRHNWLNQSTASQQQQHNVNARHKHSTVRVMQSLPKAGAVDVAENLESHNAGEDDDSLFSKTLDESVTLDEARAFARALKGR